MTSTLLHRSNGVQSRFDAVKVSVDRDVSHYSRVRFGSRRSARILIACLISAAVLIIVYWKVHHQIHSVQVHPLTRCSTSAIASFQTTVPVSPDLRIIYVDPTIITSDTSHKRDVVEGFASLKEAVLSISEARQEGNDEHPQAVIRLLPGIHLMLNGADVVHLESMHGGADRRSTIIEGYDTTNRSARNTVIVRGGVEVPWQCVQSINQLLSSKLGEHESIVNTLSRHVRVVDLDECFDPSVVKSIIAPMVPSGFAVPVMPVASQLFQGSRPYRVARWPNSDWLFTKQPIEHIQPYHNNSFSFGVDSEVISHIKKWYAAHCDDTSCDNQHWSPQDLWMTGYFSYGWADLTTQVALIDLNAGIVTSIHSSSQPVQHAENRYYFMNILDELDEPGEYFIDRNNRLLFFYPFSSADEEPLILSVLDEPFISINHAEHIIIRNLTFTFNRGTALRVIGESSSVVFQHVSVHRIGNVGIMCGNGEYYGKDRVKSDVPVGSLHYALGDSMLNRHCGHSHRVEFSSFALLGAAGVVMGGGDRVSLSNGNNVIKHNVIIQTGMMWMTYMPAILLDGVGNEVSNNRISHTPHAAILLHGNNHRVIRNDISFACMQSQDAGAIYSGRDWTQRGHQIVYNFIHHFISTLSIDDINRHTQVKRDDRSFCSDMNNANEAECYTGFGIDIRGVYMDDCASGNNISHNVFYHVPTAIFVGGGRDHTVKQNIFVDVQLPIQIDARGMKTHHFSTSHSLYTTYHNVDSPQWSDAYPDLVNLLNDEPFVPKHMDVSENLMVACGHSKFTSYLKDQVDSMNKVERLFTKFDNRYCVVRIDDGLRQFCFDEDDGAAVIEWNEKIQLQWEQYSQAKLAVERSAMKSYHCVGFGICLASNELSRLLQFPKPWWKHAAGFDNWQVADNGPCEW